MADEEEFSAALVDTKSRLRRHVMRRLAEDVLGSRPTRGQAICIVFPQIVTMCHVYERVMADPTTVAAKYQSEMRDLVHVVDASLIMCKLLIVDPVAAAPIMSGDSHDTPHPYTFDRESSRLTLRMDEEHSWVIMGFVDDEDVQCKCITVEWYERFKDVDALLRRVGADLPPSTIAQPLHTARRVFDMWTCCFQTGSKALVASMHEPSDEWYIVPHYVNVLKLRRDPTRRAHAGTTLGPAHFAARIGTMHADTKTLRVRVREASFVRELHADARGDFSFEDLARVVREASPFMATVAKSECYIDHFRFVESVVDREQLTETWVVKLGNETSWWRRMTKQDYIGHVVFSK